MSRLTRTRNYIHRDNGCYIASILGGVQQYSNVCTKLFFGGNGEANCYRTTFEIMYEGSIVKLIHTTNLTLKFKFNHVFIDCVTLAKTRADELHLDSPNNGNKHYFFTHSFCTQKCLLYFTSTSNLALSCLCDNKRDF